MKKFGLKVTLLGAVLALAAAGFAACGDETQDACEHVFGSWTVVSEATCEENGLRYHICTLCAAREDDDIPALGHDYSKITATVPATCSQEGSRTRVCSRCNKERTEVIEKLDHDWDEGTIIDPSTCQKAGTLRLTCHVCQATEDRELFLSQHDWEEVRREEAKCEQAGTVYYRCSNCETTKEETIPALRHRWESAGENTEPTCTAPGQYNRICAVCGTSDKRTLDALGHIPSDEETIDKLPTFTENGTSSRRCLRCGERIDEKTIPMLREGTPVAFTFTVRRNNGEKLLDSSVKIDVYDGEQVVASGSPRNGVFTAELVPGTAASPKTYTARLSGLPQGYAAEESYTVSPADPRCDLWVTASLLSGTPDATQIYREGSVMYDFTLPASANNTGKDITLSELLKTKKAVVLNFFFTTCGPCREEFPALMQAYAKYKNDIELLVIDENTQDTLTVVKQYALAYNLVCPVSFVPSMGLQHLFRVTSVPTTVVIDGEGVVCKIHTGKSDFETFDELIAPYVAEGYWKAPSKKPATAFQPMALPLRKRDSE